jgi:cell division protein FtsQ
MLTPGFRLFLRAGIPMLCVFGLTSWYLADQDRRAMLMNYAADLRLQIEQRPEFMVKLMAIEGASEEVAEDLREIIPIDFPISSFDLELEHIRARAEEIDAVASAAVRIKPGGVLAVTVIEREPSVVWRGRDGLELLDAEGHRVSSLESRAERPDLPLLAGDGAEAAVPEALALLEVADLISPRIRGLLRVGERRWDVVLDRDQRILLPEGNAVSALERVIGLDQVRDLLARDIAVIDMRNPDRPTLRMTADAAETFRDISKTMWEPASR